MKRRLTLLSLSLFLGLCMAMPGVFACNLSSFTLVSVTGTGPYVITANLCVGMGITGSTKGGDQSTRDISFGFYDATPGFTILGYTPNPLCGPMGCCMPSIPGPPLPGQQGTILYQDPGYYGTPPCVTSPYGCVNSNALCGNAQSFCRTVTFTVNQIPDSIRAFGVEGGGNPIGGCYPNSDMVIIFTGPTSVSWGDVVARVTSIGIEVNWTTLMETNVDFFQVERASPTGSFEPLGTVVTDGNSQSPRSYSLLDAQPFEGMNRYRVIQVDRIGGTQESQIVEVSYGSPDALSWGEVAPNPVRDDLSLAFYSPISTTYHLQLVDVAGKVVGAQEITASKGGNRLSLDMRSFNKGAYYLSLQGEGKRIVRKVVRL